MSHCQYKITRMHVCHDSRDKNYKKCQFYNLTPMHTSATNDFLTNYKCKQKIIIEIRPFISYLSYSVVA